MEARLRQVPAVLGWACLALVALLALGGVARREHGFALGWPGWGACAAVALGLWLIARTCRPGQGQLLLGLAACVLPVLTASPWPGAAALSGPPLWAMAFAGLVLLWARRPPAAWVFVPVTAALYAGVALRVQTQVGAEGDEPHYLMVAESLLRDGDVALEQDYAAGRYRAFYRAQPTLEPHYLVRGRQGEIFSQHALGLSLLVLPAYAAFGYTGASLFMALLLALLALEIRALLRQYLDDRALADGLAWVVALSPPLVHFAGLVFTEVPAALGVALALRRLRRPAELTPLAALALGAALGSLPWLNVRYLPFPLLLIAYAAWARPPRRTLLLLSLPLLASAVALGLYHFALYGFFDPRLVYGRRPGFAWGRLPSNLEALLFDQEFGLLPYAPVFALAVPGFFVLARRAGLRAVLGVLAPVVVVLCTAATWRMWWGGFTPPARFLVPVVPLLAVAAGLGLRRTVGARAALLVGWSVFMGLAGAWQPRLVHRDRDGTAPLLREFSGANEWTRLLPAYVLPDADPARHRLALVWGALLVLAVWPRRRDEPSGLSLALSVGALLAAAGAASYLSSGRTGTRDAVRALGRPALQVPELRCVRSATAAWGPDALGWGPLYEEHRFPEGAELASRLPLAPGVYRLTLRFEPIPGGRPVAFVALREPSSGPEPLPGTCPSRGQCATTFVVRPGDRAVSLRLAAGGPLLLVGVELALVDLAQPFARPPGPTR